MVLGIYNILPLPIAQDSSAFYNLDALGKKLQMGIQDRTWVRKLKALFDWQYKIYKN